MTIDLISVIIRGPLYAEEKHMKGKILAAGLCLLLLACAMAGPARAQEPDKARLIEGCSRIQGMDTAVCSCVADKLANIAADDFNRVADAWSQGKAQSPEEARELFGNDLVNLIDELFDQCGK